jgi:TRAP-type mannitol/chloroaromatic compound transport system permease small subunit
MNLSAITRLADRIDRLNTTIGHGASWCALAVVLIGFAVVLLRYVLGLGSIWLQESILYAHAALFLLAAAWTLKEGGHVRVDVFYAQSAPRTRAWVDLCGALFLLLPFALAIIVFALPYVQRSWATLERSRETSGLPLVFLLKTLIPLFALLLALQGVAQAIRAVSELIPPREAGRVDASAASGRVGSAHVAKPHPVRFADHPPPSGEG